jgi:hypothetical protein
LDATHGARRCGGDRAATGVPVVQLLVDSELLVSSPPAVLSEDLDINALVLLVNPAGSREIDPSPFVSRSDAEDIDPPTPSEDVDPPLVSPEAANPSARRTHFPPLSSDDDDGPSPVSFDPEDSEGASIQDTGGTSTHASWGEDDIAARGKKENRTDTLSLRVFREFSVANRAV